jgi:hypothetical protein
VGILEVENGHLFLQMGTSRETADCVTDSLQAWWNSRKSQHGQVRKLVIELDNGPEVMSRRTQFMRRLTRAAFAEVEARLERDPNLPRYSVRIKPQPSELLPAAG